MLVDGWPKLDLADGLALEPFSASELDALVRKVLCTVWRVEGRSLRFCDEQEICRLHETYLGDPSPTDVMSFPYGSLPAGAPPEESCEAELIVNLDMAKDAAAEHGNSPKAELALYLVHGALHLLGYDDQETAALLKMKKAEQRVLEALGLEVRNRLDA